MTVMNAKACESDSENGHPKVAQIKVKGDLLAETSHNSNHIKSSKKFKNKNKASEKKQSKKHKFEEAIKRKKEVNHVTRVLPYWLSHPVIVGNDLEKDGCSLTDLQFLSKIFPQLKQDGFNHFFPVQKLLIPAIASQVPRAFTWTRRNDFCVSAATGSGKTLAYVLPILFSIAKYSFVPSIRAVVVLPTQQLAEQILKVFKKYCNIFQLKVGSAIGFRSTSEEQSDLIQTYQDYEIAPSGDLVARTRHRAQVHIVVATPGKLEAHMEMTPGFDLSKLMFLVFDEADILLSNDGGEWVRKIEKKIRVLQGDGSNSFNVEKWPLSPPPMYAQRILLSATLSCDPEILNAIDLYNPILFCTQETSAPSSAKKEKQAAETMTNNQSNDSAKNFVRPSGLKEQLLSVEASIKPLALHHLILSRQWKKSLVFVNSTEDVHNLAMLLEILAGDSYSVAEFSAKLGNKQSVVTNKFRKGAINVLISTDVLDRGMDLDVGVVVNYHLPKSKEIYVHRIGRTARAGREGLAISLVNADHKLDKHFSQWVRKIRPTSLDTKELVKYEDQYKEALQDLKQQQNEQKKWKKMDWKTQSVGMKRKRASSESGPKKHKNEENSALKLN